MLTCGKRCSCRHRAVGCRARHHPLNISKNIDCDSRPCLRSWQSLDTGLILKIFEDSVPSETGGSIFEHDKTVVSFRAVW